MFSSQPDLRDPDAEYFTNGSSFVEEGEYLAGYSMATLNYITEVKALPKGTLAQKEEVIMLS